MKSLMAGRVVTYADRTTPVQLGDRVETRVWFSRKQGRVVYVPGVSPPNSNMEFNGLCWVGIRLDEGGFVSSVLDPKGAYLRRKEKLLRRDASGYEPLAEGADPHEGGEGTSL